MNNNLAITAKLDKEKEDKMDAERNRFFSRNGNGKLTVLSLAAHLIT